MNPSLYGERPWLHEPWYCPRTYNENETEKLFVFFSLSDHLTLTRYRIKAAHILNLIALPRLYPYLFLDTWGGGQH